MEVNELDSLRKKIERLKTEISRAEAELELNKKKYQELLNELQEKYNISSESELFQFLKSLEDELSALVEKFKNL